MPAGLWMVPNRATFPPGFRKSQVVFNLLRAVEEAVRNGGQAIVVEGFFTACKYIKRVIAMWWLCWG